MGAVDDVYNHILSSGIAGNATGWTLLRRRIMDGPAVGDQIVVIAEDGGALNEISASEGIGDAALYDTGVLVTVRGKAWDGDASGAKAQRILDLLHGLRNAVVGADDQRYLRVAAMTPEPVFAGYDDTGRPLHTIAFRMLALATPQTLPAPAPSVVTITPPTLSLVEGQAAGTGLSAVVTDQYGNPMTGQTITWGTEDAAVATIDGATRIVTATAGGGGGETRITATVGAAVGYCTVTNVARVAQAVNVAPASFSVVAGGTSQLSAQVLDQLGAELAAPVTWASSDETIATVDGTGLVTGVIEGAVTITATSGAASDTSDGTVTAADSTGLSALTADISAEGGALVAAYLAEDATVDGSNNVTGWPEHQGSGADLVLQGAVDGLLTLDLANASGPRVRPNASNTGLAYQGAALASIVEGVAIVVVMTAPADTGTDNVLADMSEGTGQPTHMQVFMRPTEGLEVASSDTIAANLALGAGAYADGARHVYQWARTFNSAAGERTFSVRVDDDAALSTVNAGATARVVAANRLDLLQHRAGTGRRLSTAHLSAVLYIALPVDVDYSDAIRAAIMAWARAHRGVPTPA